MSDLNVNNDYTKMNNLSPFKLCVLQNFPFIEADFDAVTNYQLLCKVVEYLNNVIDNNNKQNENITQLEQNFINLYNYVKNYFDNLDVQDEINNKLDELIISGKFGLYLQNYIPYVTPQMFGAKGDGVNDDYSAIMKAFNYCTNNKTSLIIFPTGDYLVSDTLIMPYNSTNSRPYFDIIGEDSKHTQIIADHEKNIIEFNGVARQNIIRPVIKSIKLNGNKKAQYGIYATFTGMINFDDLIITSTVKRGIFLDSGCWMFNLKNIYVIACGNYGVYIADNCAGSNMELVVCELNEINCYIGYTRMINIYSCTFQQYTKYGNMHIVAGWDITINTCWFEGANSLETLSNTYDLKMEKSDNKGNVGHMIRILNNSFHGIGQNNAKTYYGIIEDYSDTLLSGNYFDVSGGYTSGYWYVGTYENARTFGYNNTASDRIPSIKSYVMWQWVLGVENDLTIMTQRLRVNKELVIIPRDGLPYTYDNTLYSNNDTHNLEWSKDGRFWSLLKVCYRGSAPTTGTWRKGDIILTDTPQSGSAIGWICIEAGKPGVWKTFGNIS